MEDFQGAELAVHSHQISLAKADACAAFRRTSRAVTQLYDLVLAPTGVKATQFIVLKAVAEHGEVAQWQLAREQAIAVETLSRRLAALRSAGLVSQRIGNARRGERLYRLTAEGMAKVQEAAPYWERAEQRLRTMLGSSQWDAALALADQVTTAAREAEHLKLAARPKMDSIAAGI